MKMVTALVLLLLLPLPQTVQCVHKARSYACTIKDQLSLPYEYYQPGEFVIGGLTSHLLSSLDKEVFKENLTLNQIFNLL